MRRIRLAGLLPLIVSLGASVPALGGIQGSVTGNELLKSCTAAIRMSEEKDTDPPPSSESLYDSGYCLGFVHGIVAGVEWTSRAYERVGPSAKPVMCIPDGVSKGQLIRVVIKALKDDPAHLHIDAGALAFTALVKNFPCHDAAGSDKPK